jgi:hypothetical protein
MTEHNNHYETAALERLRVKTIEENAAHKVKAERFMDEHFDQLIEILRANKGHVGAFAVVLLAKEDDALVDPEEAKATSGISMRFNLNRHLEIIVNAQMKELEEETQQAALALPPSLAALFGGLGSGKDEEDEEED